MIELESGGKSAKGRLLAWNNGILGLVRARGSSGVVATAFAAGVGRSLSIGRADKDEDTVVTAGRRYVSCDAALPTVAVIEEKEMLRPDVRDDAEGPDEFCDEDRLREGAEAGAAIVSGCVALSLRISASIASISSWIKLLNASRDSLTLAISLAMADCAEGITGDSVAGSAAGFVGVNLADVFLAGTVFGSVDFVM